MYLIGIAAVSTDIVEKAKKCCISEVTHLRLDMANRRKSKRKGAATGPLVSNPFDAAKRKKASLSTNSNSRIKKNDASNPRNNKIKQIDRDKEGVHPPPSRPSDKPPIARMNSISLFSALPFDSNSQTQDGFSNHSNGSSTAFKIGFDLSSAVHDDAELNDVGTANHSNPSGSWLQFRSDSLCSTDLNMMSQSQCHGVTTPRHPASSGMLTQSAYLTPMDQGMDTQCPSQLDMLKHRQLNGTKPKLKALAKVSEHSDRDQPAAHRPLDGELDDSKRQFVAMGDLPTPPDNVYLDIEEKLDPAAYRRAQRGVVALNRYHSQFQELRALGRGSFGKVFQCRNRDDGCFYAVKKVKLQSVRWSLSAEQRAKAMKEGLVLSALQRNGTLCPNVILYHSMWIEQSHFYLVTEYADKGSLCRLYDHIPRGQVEEDEFCRIVENVANALLFIHSKGFIHFDVKTENILISKGGVYKLADFGLCAKIEQKESSIPKVEEGDARYLCRELIEGTFVMEQLDKVDVFALGVSVYEMITGEALPSNGFKWQQIRNGNLSWNRHHDEIPEASSNMKQLLGAMMHSNPAERPSAQQLTVFLRKFGDKVLEEKEAEIEGLKRKMYALQRQIQMMRRG